MAAPASACGFACGAGDKPEEKPAACGSACGAGDKEADILTMYCTLAVLDT